MLSEQLHGALIGCAIALCFISFVLIVRPVCDESGCLSWGEKLERLLKPPGPTPVAEDCIVMYLHNTSFELWYNGGPTTLEKKNERFQFRVLAPPNPAPDTPLSNIFVAARSNCDGKFTGCEDRNFTLPKLNSTRNLKTYTTLAQINNTEIAYNKNKV